MHLGCTKVSRGAATGKAGKVADGQAVEEQSQAEQADLDELYGGDAAEVAGDAAAAADSDDNAEVSPIAKIVQITIICYFPADNHKLISYQPPVHACPQHNFRPKSPFVLHSRACIQGKVVNTHCCACCTC